MNGALVGQKLIIRHHYIQNVNDGIKIGACTISKESLTHFRLCISVEVGKILRKSQGQFVEKL